MDKKTLKRLRENVAKLKASGKYEQLDPVQRMRADLLLGGDAMMDDPKIKKAVDDYISEKEENFKAMKGEAPAREFRKGTMTYSDHLRALKTQQERKQKFAEANRMVPDTMEGLVDEAKKINQLNQNVPDDLRKQELEEMQKRGLQRLKKANDKSIQMKRELRTPGLFDA